MVNRFFTQLYLKIEVRSCWILQSITQIGYNLAQLLLSVIYLHFTVLILHINDGVRIFCKSLMRLQ